MRRVAVTGMGVVSSIGNNTNEVLASLREARSGVTAAPEYAELGFRCQVHAPPRIDWEAMVDRRAARFLAQGTAFGHIAMEQAIADAQRPAAAGCAAPAQEEAHELPHGVQAQAAGHHRVALEVALEEPKRRVDVELGLDVALAELAAFRGDLRDAVEHQHRRQGQLGVARAEELAPPAGQQLFGIEAVLHAYGPVAQGARVSIRRAPAQGGPITEVMAPDRACRRPGTAALRPRPTVRPPAPSPKLRPP
jgi:hypothetical protein